MSRIQHYYYCPRQWALIELEQVWADDAATAEGQLIHTNANDPFYQEKRGDKLITRAVPLISHKLKLSGVCDVVEWQKNEQGLAIKGHDGLWLPTVIEYKRGKPKTNLCDKVQLCAEVMALEEMLGISLTTGELYYKQPNKRQRIAIDNSLRDATVETAQAMQNILLSRKTPKATIGRNCNMCSLKNLCLPRLTHHKRSVHSYIDLHTTREEVGI